MQPFITDEITQSSNSSERIARDLEMRLRGYVGEPKAMLSLRLQELDDEWDIERFMEAGAAALTMFGAMGLSRGRRLLPAGIGAFLLAHSSGAWRPAASFLRRFGIRTAAEINQERYALKALRGDFDDLSGTELSEERVELAVQATAS
ncbi:MAG: hypothetical protein U0136_00650 [Bdellovibrionota bacterium]